MQKWEYLTISRVGKLVFINGQETKKWHDYPTHEILNTFGAEGWELVGFGTAQGAVTHHILKRQIMN